MNHFYIIHLTIVDFLFDIVKVRRICAAPIKMHWHGFLINCESKYFMVIERGARTFDKMKEDSFSYIYSKVL